MSERNNQEGGNGCNNQTEYPSTRSELQVPVSYVDCLLGQEQDGQSISSSTTDFFLAILDYLTDYLLELVGSEASNNSVMEDPPQDQNGEGDNNHPASRNLKDMPFALFDEIPGPRKNG
ncbi:huntingtin-interacting protein M [Lepus europaeus]|uniref:huntingtin-interacting protein M n=1 Tax=Lepus europaeus TaxID=9983 RepID=UPI002B493B1D|nr:huntingtin-interacting protein M [Lepus europaeus]